MPTVDPCACCGETIDENGSWTFGNLRVPDCACGMVWCEHGRCYWHCQEPHRVNVDALVMPAQGSC